MTSMRILLAVAFLMGATALPAWAQDGAAAQCDRLAASPYDPEISAGSGVAFFSIDAIAAIEACRVAAKADPDNGRLRFQLARAYDAAEDFAMAHRNYEAAMALGNLVAAAGLGQLYEFGLGVDTDEARAAELYSPAAEAGVLVALESLGKLYEDGRGVEQNYVRAAELYDEAADDGSYWAMAALGWLTENGWGVSQDFAEAARLYVRAAEEGNIDFAQNNLATFYADGLGGIAKDPAKAVQYYTRAADQGLVLAYINLAFHYGEGIGVKKNPARAEAFLRQTIAEGDDALVARASNNLAWMFAMADKNLEEAEQLARAAVAADPEDANRLDTLAWVLHLSGRSKEALPIIGKAIAMDGDTPEYKEHRDAIAAAVE